MTEPVPIYDTPIYDTIGCGYRSTRQPDLRIAAQLEAALGDARSVVNIGAGGGSYEPNDRRVVAVEPSRVMIAQRSADAARVVQARAEALPFADHSFDAALAVLTIHHWGDIERGLCEALRVADRLVMLTWVGPYPQFWLLDYFPQIVEFDNALFPDEEAFTRMIGPVEMHPLMIPADCTDGFMCAFWRRPAAYLDANVRQAISTFAKMTGYEDALERLSDDLQSGRWHERYGHVLEEEELDLGYRIVVAGV